MKVFGSLLMLALAARAQALDIESTDVAERSEVVGEEALQKTWTVTSAEALEKLELVLPGRVFVTYAPSAAFPLKHRALELFEGSGSQWKEGSLEESGSVDVDVRGLIPGLLGPGGLGPVWTQGSVDGSDVGSDAGSSDLLGPGGLGPVWTQGSFEGSDADSSDLLGPGGLGPVWTQGSLEGSDAGSVAESAVPVEAGENSDEASIDEPLVVASESASGESEDVLVVVDDSTSKDEEEASDSDDKKKHHKDDDEDDSKDSKKKHQDDDDDESEDQKPKDDDKDESEDVAPAAPTYDGPQVVATIVVSGDSKSLLNLVEVFSLHKHKDNALKIHLKNKDASSSGYILTQIFVHEASVLRHVSASLASDVVVGDKVLVADDADAHVKLTTAGASNLFANWTSNVSLRALSVTTAGTSLVQLSTPALQLTSKLDVSLAGSGVVAVLADALVNTTQISAAVSGTGHLYVETAELLAYEILGSVYGSGVARFGSSGQVTKEKFTLAGSGVVDTSSLVAARATVNVWGSGVLALQVTDKIWIDTSFSGKVFYAGARPSSIKTSKWLFWRPTSSILKPLAAAPTSAYVAVAAPDASPVYIKLVTKSLRHDEDPLIKSESNYALVAAVTSSLSSVAHGPNGTLVFGLVAAALVVVGMAAHRLQQHRVRRNYIPLV